MLAVVGLGVVGFFLILWRWGVLDELSQRAQSRNIDRMHSAAGKPKSQTGENENRLNVYRAFIEGLSEEDEEA